MTEQKKILINIPQGVVIDISCSLFFFLQKHPYSYYFNIFFFFAVLLIRKNIYRLEYLSRSLYYIPQFSYTLLDWEIKKKRFFVRKLQKESSTFETMKDILTYGFTIMRDFLKYKTTWII